MLALRRHRLPAAQDRGRVRRLRGPSPGGRLDRPGGEVGHDRSAATPTRATTSCSRPAPSRTSSRPRAPSTRSRSTRSTTPSACGRGSSRRSRRRTATRRAPTAGRIDFVVVGGGPTGVEVAGALSEMINTTMVHEFPSLAPRAKVHLVDHGKALLEMFADKAHAYSAGVLEKDGVDLRLGIGRHRDRPGPREAVRRVDDQHPLRRVGRRADGGAGGRRRAGCRRVAGGRIDVNPDFTVDGLPGRARRSATSRTSPTGDGKTHPQLGSVALQSGSRGRQDDPRPAPGQADQAVHVPRQGDDGDDRPRGGRRPGPRHGAARQGWRSRPGSACTPR